MSFVASAFRACVVGPTVFIGLMAAGFWMIDAMKWQDAPNYTANVCIWILGVTAISVRLAVAAFGRRQQQARE